MAKKEVIYIDKGERLPLPTKFRGSNNICAIIYDQLTELFKDEIYKSLQLTTVSFKNSEHAARLQNTKLHVLDYLDKYGYKPELGIILVKNVTMAIVADLLNFVFESISCAKRGKMTIAYALLRKPFKDELLILENILNDPETFIAAFFHDKNPKSYDPSKTNDQEKSRIIEAAVKKVRPALFTAKMVHEFRYDKSSQISIAGFADHALHIVTDNRHYPTSDQNLNFVFSGNVEMQRYWTHYYQIVPYLLLYTASVVDGIVFRYLPAAEAKQHKEKKIFKRLIGYLLWLNNSFHGSKRSVNKLSKEFEDILQFECDHCNFIKPLDKADFELFFFTEMFICDKCFNPSSFDPAIAKLISEIL